MNFICSNIYISTKIYTCVYLYFYITFYNALWYSIKMSDANSKTSLILHGHFYQPPRENPSTLVIPKQPSAAPFADWNEKIYNDCYDANTHSRYLSEYGKIVSLTNNYAYISFNFGPTLLHFLDDHYPECVKLLREADEASIKRLGHGNAMAQSFNHTILPLDRPEDARLQIKWGIDDFKYHYNREPEGMWMPECGINNKVVDLLAEENIKFVVLSPWQCRAVEDDNGSIIELNGAPAPYYEPYILKGEKGGEIAVFFYHPGLAEGISFGHLLRDADNLYSTILSIKNNEHKMLIHTATDGEIYGHHEPYGDMALAALIKKVEERDDFILDNYGSYLEKHKPTKRAYLKDGEDKKGTSWSCSHGVSRWYKDCGCHTGGEEGWNQEWRTPLRNSLNNLSQKLQRVFDDEVERIFKGELKPYDLLVKAGKLLSTELSSNEFIKELHKEYKFSKNDDEKVLNLIDGIKNKHFSFTSCGFFFSEISGIEPRQDISYALYAIKMLQSFTSEDLMISFLSDLKNAKSNIKSIGSGMNIAQEELKGLRGEVEAVLYFFLNRLLAKEEDLEKHYGRFILLHYKNFDSSYELKILDKENLKSYTFSVLGDSTIEAGVEIYISDIETRNSYRITNSEIPPRILDNTYAWIDRSISAIDYDEIVKLSLNMNYYAMLATTTDNLPMEPQLLENLGFTIKLIKTALLKDKSRKMLPHREIVIGNMIDFVKKFGREEDIIAIKNILSENTESLSNLIIGSGLNEENARYILTILALSRHHGFEPETKKLQNAIYPYYIGAKATEADSALAKRVFTELNFA